MTKLRDWNSQNHHPIKPRIGLVLGDPCGIGPEIVAKLLAQPAIVARGQVIILGDRRIYERGAQIAGTSGPVQVVDDVADIAAAVKLSAGDNVLLLDLPFADLDQLAVGEVRADAGRAVLATLSRALKLAQAGVIDALCFAPLNKQAMHLGGLEFEDELRFFASELGLTNYVGELNVLDRLWTARVTSHVPLRAVAALITPASIEQAVRLVDDALRTTGLVQPKIGVAGLNPHAGDGGSFGREDIDIIAPTVAQLQAQGIQAAGPISPDIVFLRARDEVYDAVVTMYHDQGQVAMKLMGFERGVTVHGGLPFPVTTPAHGTAFDIAGQGVAHANALREAFLLACRMAEW